MADIRLDKSVALEQPGPEYWAMGRGDYAGAAGRVKPDQIRALGARWRWQEKIDGAYAVLALDGAGCVAQVLSRKLQPMPGDEARSLVGELVGRPWSLLVGELEAHTEAGRLRARKNPGGLAKCHVFDAIQVGRDRVAELPYSERRDMLYRGWARIWEGYEPSQKADRNGALHGARGRFEAPRIEGVCRVPVVRQWADFDSAWEAVSSEDGEGLVAVAADAPLGRRGAKKKYKAAHDIDVTVLATSERVATVWWPQAAIKFAVSCIGREIAAGQVWKLKHESFYDSGIPKFPRLVERRMCV